MLPRKTCGLAVPPDGVFWHTQASGRVAALFQKPPHEQLPNRVILQYWRWAFRTFLKDLVLGMRVQRRQPAALCGLTRFVAIGGKSNNVGCTKPAVWSDPHGHRAAGFRRWLSPSHWPIGAGSALKSYK